MSSKGRSSPMRSSRGCSGRPTRIETAPSPRGGVPPRVREHLARHEPHVAGAQHPTFRYDLRGQGKLVLTELPVHASLGACPDFLPAGPTS